MRRADRGGRRLCVLVAVSATVAAWIGPLPAQEGGNPQEAIAAVLDSARRAYNEGNFAFAAERFREFLKRQGDGKDAAWGHYGLALTLMELPDRDAKAIMDSFRRAAQADFPERASALYHLGACVRDAAVQAQAAGPGDAAERRAAAGRGFEEAAGHFAAAATAFAARVKAPPAPSDKLPDDLEWAARARCDQVEMLLRLKRFKEAAAAAGAVLADPALGRSQARKLAVYHLGFAQFALKDYQAAGKALIQLAPFGADLGEIGVHARYLLGRTHHMAGERPEAAAHYKALIADYEARRKSARELMKNPQALRPEHRAALDALLKNPPPDYVARASFYLALLAAEEGRYADGLTGFAAFIQQFPKSELVPEAQLRQGFCHLQSKAFAEAIKALAPLADHPQLGDQATWWLARAQVGAADPANAQAVEAAAKGAIDLLRRAADKARELAKTDPDAKARRTEILLELGDTQQLAKQHAEAASTCQQVLAEQPEPARAEEALQRLAAALHLAGRYKESDDVCLKFRSAHPQSVLLPAVLFRSAENAYLTAVAAANDPARRDNKQELNRLFDEAIGRYDRLLKQFPDFAYANLARQALAAAHYQLGRFDQAIAILSAIPESDRTGDLAGVNYLLADCLIRTFPPETEDALQAAKFIDQAMRAAKLLEGFISSQGKSAQAADALLKLGHCYQRIGALLVEPGERAKILAQARQAYDQAIQQQSRRGPGQATAVFERAKCSALMGEPAQAMEELRRFQGEPLNQSPIAPLAALRLASLMRSQNRSQEAANLLAQCRSQHEAGLLKDPARAEWVPMIRYEQALAVKESGKLAEAKAMFESLAKEFAGRPEGVNAAWRVGQCRREELAAILTAARQGAARRSARPEEVEAAKAGMRQALKELQATVEFLQAQAAALAKGAPGGEAHLRVLYETAWCLRTLAEAEVESARRQLQKEALAQMQAMAAKEPPPAGAAPVGEMVPPEIPLSAVPEQPAEKACRAQYEQLIAAAKGQPMGVQARLELAELLADRGQGDPAVELLGDALGASPTPELAEQIRLRLAAAMLARKDAKTALSHVEAVMKSPSGRLAGEARYLAGEAAILQNDWPKAIEWLLPFRDQERFQRVAGISDRALLRLGHAYCQLAQWDAGRQTYEALVQRFPRSPWVDEARYGIGWCLQNRKDPESAVSAYTEVIRRSVSEVAARAQLQIGLCRMEQKRYPEAANALVAVAFTYGYPEWSASAWCEAGRAYVEMKQPAEAAKLWQRVLREHPTSQWAQVARQRLAEIKQ